MIDLLFRKPRWTHDVCYINQGSRTFPDFVDKLKAAGAAAASIRGDESLADRPVSPKEWKRLIQTIEKVAEHGYRKLEGTNMVKTWIEDDGTPVCEIRKGQSRVFFFEDEPDDENSNGLILTHGYLKKTNETPDREIDRYKSLREDYFEWKFDADRD